MLRLALSMPNCSLLLDHAQLSLICGPNIPGSYAMFFFSIRHYFYHQTHPQLSMVSTLVQQLNFMELLVIAHCSSPVAFQPGGLIFSGFFFFFFFAFLNGSCGSQQEHCSVSPFPTPVDHILLGLSIMTHPSWVAMHGMTHSFIELY